MVTILSFNLFNTAFFLLFFFFNYIKFITSETNIVVSGNTTFLNVDGIC